MTELGYKLDDRKTAGNTGFASGGVTCKLVALCFVSSVVLVDSLVLRNPPERKARNRYLQAYPNPFHRRNFTKKLSKNLNYSNFILTKSNNKQ